MKLIKRQNIIKEVVIGVKCDVCETEHIGNISDEWHNFSSHHDGWGNDSCASYEYYDVCSIECYKQQLEECLKDLEEYSHWAWIDGFTYEFTKRLVKCL
jgi:hypothetical protein